MQVAPHSDKWSLTAATKCCHTFSTNIPGCDDSLCIPVVFMHLGGDFCIRKLHCSLPSSRILFNQTSEFLWAEIPEKHPTIQNLELDRLDQKLVKNSVTFFSTKYGFSNDFFKLLKFWCCRKKSLPGISSRCWRNFHQLEVHLKTSPATRCLKKNGTNS